MSDLKVGVAGAGVFGGYHAQKAAASASTELTGIFDISDQRGQTAASPFGVPNYTRFEDLLEKSDAIIIAVPAVYHADLAAKALQANKHVLVEKPLALKETEARMLAGMAVSQGLTLQVGHQERFVARAMGMFRIEEPPLLLESIRYSPPSPEGRAGDVSVIWDLMIHDLDLAGCLIEGRFTDVSASGQKLHTDHIDEASAEFEYDRGARAILKASRAAKARERKMRVVYESGEISVDFLSREVINTTPYNITVDISALLPDPLGAADESFFQSCLGRQNSVIPGHGAIMAVAMAEAAEAQALS
ncbi:MAG: Gfo/Idh/MocA family oxidoreductase [Ponticaulis sp.]|nr:Gfo/Idh/MocA family oxidoreductase [Ponticaulis sp.]